MKGSANNYGLVVFCSNKSLFPSTLSHFSILVLGYPRREKGRESERVRVQEQVKKHHHHHCLCLASSSLLLLLLIIVANSLGNSKPICIKRHHTRGKRVACISHGRWSRSEASEESYQPSYAHCLQVKTVN